MYYQELGGLPWPVIESDDDDHRPFMFSQHTMVALHNEVSKYQRKYAYAKAECQRIKQENPAVADVALKNENRTLKETIEGLEDQISRLLIDKDMLQAAFAKECDRTAALSKTNATMLAANLNTLAGGRIATAQCVICLSESATHIITSCGHLLFCHLCATGKEGLPCPVCRIPVTSVIKVFCQ